MLVDNFTCARNASCYFQRIDNAVAKSFAKAYNKTCAIYFFDSYYFACGECFVVHKVVFLFVLWSIIVLACCLVRLNSRMTSSVQSREV